MAVVDTTNDKSWDFYKAATEAQGNSLKGRRVQGQSLLYFALCMADDELFDSTATYYEA